MKNSQVEVFCSFCGKVKLVRTGEFKKSKTGRFYCNQKCVANWKKKYLSGKNSPIYKGKVKMKCDNCGKNVEKYPCHTKYGTSFCNRKCQGEYQSKFWMGKNNPSFTSVLVKCSRHDCGKEFYIEQNRFKMIKNFFCSIKCKAHWQKTGLTGENNPSWLGDDHIREYGPDFGIKLKTIIRERDEFTCQECGSFEQNEKFCCHHIDYDKRNNSIYNFALLCRKCHPITNGNRNHWEGKYTKLISKKYRNKEKQNE